MRAAMTAENREYQRRIETAIVSAILDASKVDGMAAPVLLNGEIILACIKTIAFLGVSSGAARSQSGGREFSDWIRTRLGMHVSALTAAPDRGEVGFVTEISPVG